MPCADHSETIFTLSPSLAGRLCARGNITLFYDTGMATHVNGRTGTGMDFQQRGAGNVHQPAISYTQTQLLETRPAPVDGCVHGWASYKHGCMGGIDGG